MKRFMGFLLAAILVLLPLAAGAETGEDFTFSDNEDGTVTLTRYTGSQQNVTIPAAYGGKRVTVIGNRAFFQNRTMQRVTVPEGVVSIGTMAFAQSAVADVRLPVGLQTLGDNVFNGARNIEAIDLPEGLTDISQYALTGCDGLRAIHLPSTLENVPPALFEQLTYLRKITVATANRVFADWDGVLVQTTTMTLWRVPQNLRVTKYAVPEGILAIGECAFHQCIRFTAVTLPASVKSVGYGAFIHCSKLAGIKVNTGNKSLGSLQGVLYEKATATLHTYPAGKNATRYTVPKKLKAIGNHAFNGCTFQSLVVPASVTYIAKDAFTGAEIRNLRFMGK
jgi:hypothetical protein